MTDIALDYIGKLTIVLVVVAVAVAAIANLDQSIENDLPILERDSDGLEVVEVSSSDAPEEIAALATLCYERSLDRPTSFGCFVARSKSGTELGVTASEIRQSMRPATNRSTRFEDSNIDRSSAIIRYDSASSMVTISK